MESHGGYLLRIDGLDAASLVLLARRALPLDSVADPSDVSLLISAIPHRKVVRLAYDAAFTYGRRGARWYQGHHALARLASRELGTVVHAYVFDADEMEQVTSYGNGSRVGGETLYIEDADVPDEADLDDEASWERMKEKWPLGHLSRVYGVTRDELVRMPRYATSVLLDLDAPSADDIAAIEALLPSGQRAISA